MQMIDVLKRLAELDAQNPNVEKTIVKEDAEIAECGPQGLMGGMDRPSTPASINITAGSGEELSDMLSTIMQLAGVHKVGDEHMGVEPPQAVVSAEPMTAADSMRGVIDKMHDMGAGEPDMDQGDEEETDESAMYDNTPNDPTDKNEFDADEFAHHPNTGSTHGRATKNNPHGNPMGHEQEKKEDNMTMEQRLMAEYQNFIGE